MPGIACQHLHEERHCHRRRNRNGGCRADRGNDRGDHAARPSARAAAAGSGRGPPSLPAATSTGARRWFRSWAGARHLPWRLSHGAPYRRHEHAVCNTRIGHTAGAACVLLASSGNETQGCDTQQRWRRHHRFSAGGCGPAASALRPAPGRPAFYRLDKGPIGPLGMERL